MSVVVPIVVPIVAAITAIIESLIMVAVPMPAVFPADVMAVNPCPVVVCPMAGDPNHLIIARPITRAVAVIRPVTDLNAKALSSRGGRK